MVKKKRPKETLTAPQSSITRTDTAYAVELGSRTPDRSLVTVCAKAFPDRIGLRLTMGRTYFELPALTTDELKRLLDLIPRALQVSRELVEAKVGSEHVRLNKSTVAPKGVAPKKKKLKKVRGGFDW